MIKKIVELGAIGAGALLAELAVHSYLDIMYKETIPPALIKRIMNSNQSKGMDEFAEFTQKSCEWINHQKIEEIDLKNNRGDVLKGYFLPAKEESKKFVLFAHGYRSDHLGDPANFERFYHECGYNFLSVDHTAAGKSQGNFVGFDYYEADDMLQWVDYLIGCYGTDIQILLHGVSMGGATVCKMASRVPCQVRAIISDCAYTSARDEFIKVAGDAGVKKIAPALINAINVLNKRLAHYDLSQTDVRNSVENTKVPMLFVHGGIDDFVPVEMCYELYDICGGEKELFIVDKAYHAQSIMIDGEGYRNRITEFTSKYITD